MAMSEWRADPVTGRWVVIGANAPLRRGDFDLSSGPTLAAAAECPLCEGHEDATGAEILAVRDGSEPNGPGWQLRVVPNGVPVLRTEHTFESRHEGLLQRADGLGAHEVTVESPDHGASWSTMPPEALTRVLVAWRDRVADLRRDTRLQAVVVFKNHGLKAGARLAHPHSQLIAMPLVPPTLAQELDGAKRHYDATGRCVFCDLVSGVVADGARVVQESPGVVTFAPYAARAPFEVWVVPRGHQAHFEASSVEVLGEVAAALGSVVRRFDAHLESPDYNVVLHTAPYRSAATAFYHWHLELVPRLSRVTGFDWASGTSINPVSPEEAARVLTRPISSGAA